MIGYLIGVIVLGEFVLVLIMLAVSWWESWQEEDGPTDMIPAQEILTVEGHTKLRRPYDHEDGWR